ncbi:DegV family protein [Paenibacillus antibioticophila]|uniref:DegV family protein n=4 Tax=Paenibacillus TaxID=44249 RepID=A0A920CKJ3_9BACL|nr:MULTISPECIES: DegV family protein [Paenibacillus]GIO38632.1 DegV family protein [Paenibacillus antibioticophila]GIO42580.1 DegV family protein [Paenibacillus apis]
MSKVKIFADSTSDLPAGWASEHHIGIIPLYVVFDDHTYRDGLDINPEQLYSKVDAIGSLPKTTAPSPKDFMDAFAPYIERGEEVVYLSISSHLSSTYQNALLAAGEFPEGRVHVVDSLNLCSGIGLLVMKAVGAAQQGKSGKEIAALLEDCRSRVETEFVIDTLEYLYKGGRCSGMQNFIGSLLQIRPVLKLVDGTIIPAYKVRGKQEKAIQQMLDNALAQKDRMDDDLIIVAHTMAEEAAQKLAAILREQTGVREVALAEAGCVISSHCGPHTVAIMYMRKS